jgi:hypothetical protein
MTPPAIDGLRRAAGCAPGSRSATATNRVERHPLDLAHGRRLEEAASHEGVDVYVYCTITNEAPPFPLDALAEILALEVIHSRERRAVRHAPDVRRPRGELAGERRRTSRLSLEAFARIDVVAALLLQARARDRDPTLQPLSEEQGTRAVAPDEAAVAPLDDAGASRDG